MKRRGAEAPRYQGHGTNGCRTKWICSGNFLFFLCTSVFQTEYFRFNFCVAASSSYSTVTDFARFLGLSTSVPFTRAAW